MLAIRLTSCFYKLQGAHNDFDFFGDVLDPLAMFLRKHERGPWSRGGVEAPEMGLDLKEIAARVADAGPGEVDEYPFAAAEKTTVTNVTAHS